MTSLDRLGRNYEDIKNTVAFLKHNKVSLNILDAQFLKFNTGNDLLDTVLAMEIFYDKLYLAFPTAFHLS